MRDLESSQPVLSGSLLIAHPGLQDPNFHRTVLLLSAHSPEQGALGVILNRPMDCDLGDWQEAFANGPLAEVPVYRGGPVADGELILVAWRWNPQESSFQLYFGVAPEKLKELMEEDSELEVRAYAGYSGWSAGQLEGELGEHAWLVAPVSPLALEGDMGSDLWRELVCALRPELRFLALSPDDPSLN